MNEYNGHNYEVVAELRSDLTDEERDFAVKKVEDYKRRLKIVNSDNVYRNEQPVKGRYDDFGSVTFFYVALEDMKEYFSHLEYHDKWGNESCVTVGQRA